MKTTSPLCRCNNCYGIFVDMNPQLYQPEFEDKEYPDLERLKEGDGDEVEFYWGCPTCQTDGYLMDVTDTEMLSETLNETNLI